MNLLFHTHTHRHTCACMHARTQLQGINKAGYELHEVLILYLNGTFLDQQRIKSGHLILLIYIIYSCWYPNLYPTVQDCALYSLIRLTEVIAWNNAIADLCQHSYSNKSIHKDTVKAQNTPPYSFRKCLYRLGELFPKPNHPLKSIFFSFHSI